MKKLIKFMMALGVIGAVIPVAAVFAAFLPEGGSSGGPALKTAHSGKLPAEWERFEIPPGKFCSVYPAEESAKVTIRPNGDELLAHTMNYSGVATMVLTGEPVKRIAIRTRYLLYRAEGESVGTPYAIDCTQ